MMWDKRADMVVHGQEPFNAEPPPQALIGDPLTPVDTFYSRNHGPIPEVEVDDWRLTVDGLVTTPLTLSADDLRARFSEHTLTATLQCAGTRRTGLIAVRDIPGETPWREAAVSTASWTGVRLADVLAAAGVENGSGTQNGADDDVVRHVAFLAPDVAPGAKPAQAFGGSIPLSKALGPEVLLAWAMNGEPLTAVHGAPLRVVVPGWIGARSVKWIERITVQDDPSDNWFQANAYRMLPADAGASAVDAGEGFSLGELALTSAILDPVDGAIVPPGRLTVTGYALAGGGRGVARVDVSADGGATWTQADLGEDRGPWCWRQWTTTVNGNDGRAGTLELVARAWDTSAALQPEDPAGLWNPKGYMNNAWPRARVQVSAGAGRPDVADGRIA
ncbi:molybdopterin-dependent oxidoreductase [Tersicoccus sp. Bi-70]|uniref:molybdopterin-dependent oxidoreductase n=1 Tax=Tersicoccus sp. Bi-70 TaxID=1897634 RepID=UPI000976E6B9|nr:molybdopterin-dependent oxidoreductase [Tersicoccus sp. Bi-70]OMH34255.1 sulfite oxidase [Tersicoccus sp. Bi-70]